MGLVLFCEEKKLIKLQLQVFSQLQVIKNLGLAGTKAVL
jgi:hypothetical protein